MTDYINHAAFAEKHLRDANRHDDFNADQHIAAAQVDATLALVEQQRIANLIALGAAGHEQGALFHQVPNPNYSEPSTVSDSTTIWVPEPRFKWELRPEIAAALGIEGGDDQ